MNYARQASRNLFVETGLRDGWRDYLSAASCIEGELINNIGAIREQQVLFERESGGGDTAESGKAGKDVAYALRAGASHSGDKGTDGPAGDEVIDLIAFDETQITSPGNYSVPKVGDPVHPLAAGARPPTIAELVPILETLQRKGYNSGEGDTYASAQEANTREILRVLRGEVGEEAFTQWGFGILDSLQSAEVLQQTLYGIGIRRAAREAGLWVDDSALPRAEDLPTGAMRKLWQDGPDGRSPQGQRLAQQLAAEFGKALPKLPYENTPKQTNGVRRLTPVEAERLQGFPDGWTTGQPDSTRYRQLGNAVAVPVIAWLARRLQG